jgi:hypothetical protein
MGFRLCDEAVVLDGAEEAVPGGHQGAAASDGLGDGAGFAGTAGKGLGMTISLLDRLLTALRADGPYVVLPRDLVERLAQELQELEVWKLVEWSEERPSLTTTEG